MKNLKKRGFTLIELLVVIAIIGMLAGIVLVSLGSARRRARDTRRTSDIRQVVSAQEMYQGEYEVYYATTSMDGIPAIGNYMPAIDDPQSAGGIHYKWYDNYTDINCRGQKFCVLAQLEEKGTCTTQYRVVVGSQDGVKEACVNAIPPLTSNACGSCPP